MAARNPNWWSTQHTNPLPSSSTGQPSSLLSLLHHHHHFNFHGGSLPSSSPSSSSTSSSSSSTPSLPFSPLVDVNDHSAPQDFPQSWSQLLLGGLASSGEEDQLQAGKVESWEGGHVINPSSSSPSMDHSKVYDHHHHHNQFLVTKQESYGHGHNDDDNSNNNNFLDFSSNNFKERGRGKPPLEHSSECDSPTTPRGLSKKPRVQSSSIPPLKVRKEKLGDRITALHQIVSPFGKTDTASVLLEAVGYIRFLQSQIEALSSPYLSNGTAKTQHSSNYQIKNGSLKDLRSKGLCLVPTSCTQLVGNDTATAADYWAPSVGGGF